MRIFRDIILLLSLVLYPATTFAVEDTTTKLLDAKGSTVDIGDTYISPFLERDRINIVALGDWLAHGIWWGMFDRYKKDKTVHFTRNTNYSSGFVRKERFDWQARIESYVSRKRVDVAIIAIGMNDGRDIRVGDQIQKFNSQKWREIYKKRVDRFIVSLKQHGTAIYWVGLPIVRHAEKAEENKILNGIYKQLARKNDIKFIESWYAFTDKNGQFTYAGLDVNDNPKVLRATDGKHFTMPGYRKLGKLIDRTLSADMSAMDAAAQSSLKGSREREIAIKTPDAGRKGSLTPEYNVTLKTRGSDASNVNWDPLRTGSIQRKRILIDAGTDTSGQNKDEMTPTAIEETKSKIIDVSKPEPEQVDNSLASPEMTILSEGGHLVAKPGRDDDYRWPQQLRSSNLQR